MTEASTSKAVESPWDRIGVVPGLTFRASRGSAAWYRIWYWVSRPRRF